MSFRKRNVPVVGRTPPSAGQSPSTPQPRPDPASSAAPPPPSPSSAPPPHLPSPPQQSVGVRPSPIDGRPVTSTGAPDLDALLAGHGGLALGTSLLVEEGGGGGATDFAAALARRYAAEGLAQGHRVHVAGVDERWARELPGIVEERGKKGMAAEEKESKGKDREPLPSTTTEAEKMRIAWRYERLGQFGSRDAPVVSPADAPFTHTFDLTTRMPVARDAPLHVVPLGQDADPFEPLLTHLQRSLRTTPAHIPHRVVLPSILLPTTYPPGAAHPNRILPMLHALRALLRTHSTRLSALVTLPLALYPRETGLVRWVETLCDGVVELVPFGADPLSSVGGNTDTAGTRRGVEERPHGVLRVHRLPVFHERGGGGGGAATGDGDLGFVVSRRRFRIVPLHLPPVDGDAPEEAQRAAGEESAGRRLDGKALEF